MSRASERKVMAEDLAAYSLMSPRQLAGLLNVSEEIAKDLIRERKIPSVPVGKKMRRVDPYDAIVYLLAHREGTTVAAFCERHGEAVVELVREHYARIRKMQASAA